MKRLLYLALASSVFIGKTAMAVTLYNSSGKAVQLETSDSRRRINTVVMRANQELETDNLISIRILGMAENTPIILPYK